MNNETFWMKRKTRHLSKCRTMQLDDLVKRFHATDNACERIVIYQYVKENYELVLWSWKQ